MIRRRRPDRGSATVELAVGLPALILLLLVGITVLVATTTRMQALDAAREGALAAARGESGEAAAGRVAPPGASIAVGGTADTVDVTVRVSVHVLGSVVPPFVVDATATAAREPDAP